MFGNSTVYHALFYVVSVHPAMQVMDHAGIYFLIAGTYTPYIVIGCEDLMYNRKENLTYNPKEPTIVNDRGQVQNSPYIK